MARMIDADILQELCNKRIKDTWNSNTAPVSWAEAYADFKDDIDSIPTLTPTNDWISVEDRLPEAEKEVWIACKTKPSGYLYQCIGFYIPHGFYQEDSDYTWDWETLGEYSEERDDYCINEGWYERVHNWDDYGAVVIGDFVTHWMPLPQPPKEAQP